MVRRKFIALFPPSARVLAGERTRWYVADKRGSQ